MVDDTDCPSRFASFAAKQVWAKDDDDLIRSISDMVGRVNWDDWTCESQRVVKPRWFGELVHARTVPRPRAGASSGVGMEEEEEE